MENQPISTRNKQLFRKINPVPHLLLNRIKAAALKKKDQDEQIEQLMTDIKELKKKKNLKEKKEAPISNFIVIGEDIVNTEQENYVIKMLYLKKMKAFRK